MAKKRSAIPPYVFVVEMLVDEKWLPTSGSGILRTNAERERKDWKKRNPCDRFRVCKYRRIE